MSEKIIVFHHNDADGIVSAYLTLQTIGVEIFLLNEYDSLSDKNTIFSVDYTDMSNLENKNWKNIFENAEKIIITDCVLTKELMDLISKHKSKCVWIDHHQTSKEQYEELWNDAELKGIRNTNMSASMLSWKYRKEVYADVFDLGEGTPPSVVSYVDDYDTWRFTNYLDTNYFMSYFNLYINSVVSLELDEMVNNNEEEYIKECLLIGKGLYDKQKKNINEYSKLENIHINNGIGFVNVPQSKSLICNEMLKKHPSLILACAYHIEKGQVHVSVRSLNGKSKDFAERFNGGGHPNASGFSVKIEELHALLYNTNI